MSEKFLNQERTGELWNKVKEYVNEHGGGSSGGGVPIGTIAIWSGTVENIPAGWALCDGQNGRPDLRDKFVLGFGENHEVGETGGEEEVKLDKNQMPRHTHEQNTAYDGAQVKWYYTNTAGSSMYVYNINRTKSASGVSTVLTGVSGNNESHNNMPPYYTLCYIIKVTADAAGGTGGTSYDFGHGLKVSGTTVFVDTVSDFTGDNTLPMTAAGVQATVGNIEVLLGTI